MAATEPADFHQPQVQNIYVFFLQLDVLKTWCFVNLPFCKPDVSDVLKPDVLKPDVLKPDVLKPDVLWVYRLRSQGIDSEESIQPTNVTRARIFKQSMGARNRVGIGLSHRPAKLHRLSEFIPWNWFLRSLNIYKYRLRLHWLGELVPWNWFIGSLNVYKYRLRLHWLAELFPWNQFLGSITWRTKTKMIFFRSKQIYSSLNYQRDEE